MSGRIVISPLNLPIFVVAAVALGGCLTPEPIPKSPLAELPNVSVRYYDVTGVTVPEIRRSIIQRRPGPYDSSTHTSLNFRVTRGGNPCSVTAAEILHQTTISLPRLLTIDRLDEDTRLRWEAYVAALEEHEKGHVVITSWQVERLRPRLEQASCNDVSRTIALVRRSMAWAHEDYDNWTEHGWIQGVAFGGPYFTAPSLNSIPVRRVPAPGAP